MAGMCNLPWFRYTPRRHVTLDAATLCAQRGGKAVDGSQFDAWTRRKFGLAASGVAASLLGLASVTESDARRKNKNKNNNNKKKKNKKKCRKLGQTCDINNKNQKCCNNNQDCAQVQGFGSGNFCCKPQNASCSVNTDCCGNRKCNSGRCVNP